MVGLGLGSGGSRNSVDGSPMMRDLQSSCFLACAAAQTAFSVRPARFEFQDTLRRGTGRNPALLEAARLRTYQSGLGTTEPADFVPKLRASRDPP